MIPSASGTNVARHDRTASAGSIGRAGGSTLFADPGATPPPSSPRGGTTTSPSGTTAGMPSTGTLMNSLLGNAKKKGRLRQWMGFLVLIGFFWLFFAGFVMPWDGIAALGGFVEPGAGGSGSSSGIRVMGTTGKSGKSTDPLEGTTLVEQLVYSWSRNALITVKNRQPNTVSVIIPVRSLNLPADILHDIRSIATSITPKEESLGEVILVAKNQRMASQLSIQLHLQEWKKPATKVTVLHGRPSTNKNQDSLESLLQQSSFGELAAQGIFSSTSQFVLLLFPSHYPQTSLRDFVGAMFRHQKGANTGLISCAVRNGDLIHDFGHEMVFGQTSRGQPASFMERSLAGFSAKDARVQGPALRSFVAPHCLLGPAKFFLDAKSTRAFAIRPSRLDLAFSNYSFLGPTATDDISFSLHLVEKIAEMLTAILSSLSVAEVTKADTRLKKIIPRAYQAVQEADGFVLQGKSSMQASDAVMTLMQNKDNEMIKKVGKMKQKMSQLEYLVKEFGYVRSFLKKVLVGATSGFGDPEESLGWELSVVAKLKKKPVEVIPVFTDLRLELLPTVEGIANASIPINLESRLAKQYSRQFTLHRYQLSSAQAPVRVVWDTHCCHCCGFTNEIVHLIVPLQTRYDVHMIPDATCFCPGFPSSVTDTIERLYIPRKTYEQTQLASDEVLVWISHRDPGAFPGIKGAYGRKPEYIVGRSMYEMTKMLPHWVTGANAAADEVWVPAEWVRRIFIQNGVKNENLVVIPEAIDTDFFDPDIHKKIGLPVITRDKTYHRWCNHPYDPEQTKNYKFFSNFKWEPRKGWEILFDAYFTTFNRSEAVSLYILTHIWFPGPPETHGDKHNVTLLESYVKEYTRKRFGLTDLSTMPHFCFLAKDLGETEVAEIYGSVDAFVMPTRGEGWGLPTIQAMAMGLPTISTNWGGQMEFMTPETSFLIGLDGLDEIPFGSVYDWDLGKKWAIPSLSDTARAMRAVFDDPEYGRIVGRRARKHIVTHFSEPALLEQIDARLKVIRQIVLRRRGVSPLIRGSPKGGKSGFAVKSDADILRDALRGR